MANIFQEGDIIIPDMQRKFVFDTSKYSKIIESVLICLPISPLFMDKGENSYKIIEGFQCLIVISNYILGNQWGIDK